MKKVLFLVAVLMMSISAMAQKVIYDQTNGAGVRTIVCSGMNLGVSGNMDMYVALAGFQYKKTVRYALAVTIGSGHQVEIPSDSKCLLTLENGKILELPTVAGGISALQEVDVELSDVYQAYRRFSYYDIKAKELKKISKDGITQIQVQLLPTDYSMMLTQNVLGVRLIDSMALINNMLGK